MIELQNDVYQKPAIITKATIYPSDYLYMYMACLKTFLPASQYQLPG